MGRLRTALVVLAAAAALITFGAFPPPAASHPLGNFTVNRYARVEVSAGVIRVHYVLDEAEIPAFQDREEVAADREGFASRRARDIAGGLRLVVDGVRLPLDVAAHDLSEPPGQGGLPTLRLAVTYAADLPASGPAGRHRAELVDANEPDRIGWREILVVAKGDARVLSPGIPGDDQSDELRTYPDDLSRAPLDRRALAFEFSPGTVPAGPSPLTRSAVAPEGSRGGLASLVARTDVTLPVLLGMLALAALFGAAHALGPGHGKTVMAAYLSAAGARARDALFLGATVSLMHTASVLLLGIALSGLNRSIPPERVYPWLSVASGVIVTAVGVWLVRSRFRSLRHRGHHHVGTHHHHHDAAAPLSRRGLAVLATSGGLFPSPSAVVVLLASFSLGRAGLGLALIAAFSAGLAGTLTAVGLALLYGRRVVDQTAAHGLAGILPVLSAAAIVAVGLLVLAQGAARLA